MRPTRLCLPDFAGRPFSLATGPQSWQQIRQGGKDLLLLGLGPEAAWELPFARKAIEEGGQIYWLEAPEVAPRLEQFRNATLPPSLAGCWRQIGENEIPVCARDASVYFYSPGLRLAPRFWSPILAKIGAAMQRCAPTRAAHAWLPGNSSQLLHQELATALLKSGYSRVLSALPKPDAEHLVEAFDNSLPGLAISVNFRGLDPEGRIFGLCRELGIPLAIWLVDNPWNLLQAIPLPWWQEANLFVTDASYIAGLKAYGAKNVWLLPLAAGLDRQDQCARSGPPVFVGRSAFPDKKKFFAGLHPETSLVEQEASLNGGKPDFHWWQARYQTTLWPGKESRLVAAGADAASTRRKALWLKAALPHGIRIIGDQGWQEYLPQTRILSPVDYYGGLARIYADASCVLNVTSLLLPHSLNQRHFDVWATGGILFTDFTSGLEIFPKELVEPVVLRAPDEFPEKLASLGQKPAFWNELALEWRHCIAQKHSYEQRIQEIRRRLSLAGPESGKFY